MEIQSIVDHDAALAAWPIPATSFSKCITVAPLRSTSH
jgi:hypothetical protein